jgi:hypothetical protein
MGQSEAMDSVVQRFDPRSFRLSRHIHAIHGYKTYVFLAKSLEAPEASDSFGLSKVATWKMEKLDENWSVDLGRIVDSDGQCVEQSELRMQ